jgi:hypothetical protein
MEDLKEKLGLGANKRTFGLLTILVAIPVVIGLIGFIQHKSQKDPQVLAANQVNDLLAKVGKLMDVPDETPTVATVSDVSKLSNQEFFKKAQNGDKVLIFPKAQKAILYRPATNKIVEVAFYSPPEATHAVTQAVTPTPTAPVSLRELLNKTTPSPKPNISPSVSPTVSASPTP